MRRSAAEGPQRLVVPRLFKIAAGVADVSGTGSLSPSLASQGPVTVITGGENMTGWLWGLAMVLTAVGALFYWGARVLAVESFDADAGCILALALICAVLAQR